MEEATIATAYLRTNLLDLMLLTDPIVIVILGATHGLAQAVENKVSAILLLLEITTLPWQAQAFTEMDNRIHHHTVMFRKSTVDEFERAIHCS